MRLQTKTILICLTLSLVPLAVIGVVAYRHDEAMMKDSLGSAFQQRAREMIDRVDWSLYETFQKVLTWGGMEQMQEVVTGDLDGKLSSFLIELSKRHRDFSNLYVLNRAGETVAASAPVLIGQNLSGGDCYQRAIGGQASMVDVRFDAISQAWVVPFAFPIQAVFEEGQVIGVFCTGWKAEELLRMTQPGHGEAAGSLSDLILLRHDGLLIAAPVHERAGLFKRNLLESPLRSVRFALQRQSGYLIEPDWSRRVSVIGYDHSKGHRDFPGFGWVALVVQDVRRAFAPIERMKMISLWMGIAVGGCVIALSWPLSRRMTSPILKIAQVARRVAEGHFDTKVDYASGDEIGSLANSFNQMVEDLKRQRAQLVEKEYVDNIIGSMSDILMVIDPHATIRTVNRAACALLGYEERELTGQPAHTVMGNELLGQGSGVEPLLTRGPVDNFETTYIAKDGKNIPVLFSSALMRDAGGKVQGIVCAAKDVTERKQAEEALRQRAEELARSNAELALFAYVASHDLQEPLRTVGGFAQLLARRYHGKLGPDADEFIGFTVDGVARMQRLINDLLMYSRVGTRAKPFAPTDCAKVVARAVASFNVTIEEQKAAVTCDALPTVLADAAQLNQLFQNLIANALKFHGPQAPRVHIAAERQGAHWVFAVRDNGIGIDPKYAERIFVMFQHLHTIAEYPGTGIGLAVCKKIVERHGGRIWVESSPGQGATFHFTIPALEAIANTGGTT